MLHYWCLKSPAKCSFVYDMRQFVYLVTLHEIANRISIGIERAHVARLNFFDSYQKDKELIRITDLMLTDANMEK